MHSCKSQLPTFKTFKSQYLKRMYAMHNAQIPTSERTHAAQCSHMHRCMRHIASVAIATSEEHFHDTSSCLFCYVVSRNVFRFRTTNNNRISHRKSPQYNSRNTKAPTPNLLQHSGRITQHIFRKTIGRQRLIDLKKRPYFGNYGKTNSISGIVQTPFPQDSAESNIAIPSFKSYLRIPYRFIRNDILVSGIP